MPSNTISTLPELLKHSARRFSDVRAMYAPHEKPVVERTYLGLSDDIAAFGAGLLRAGLELGDHIALYSDNRPQWLVCDFAVTGIGAADVPRGSDTATSEFEFILEHSECAAAILQNKKLYDRLSESPIFKRLKFVVLLDDLDTTEMAAEPKAYSFQDISEMGRGHEAEFEAATKQVTPETVATIVYTSGTTGSPKGVVLTHGNLVTQPLNIDMGLKPNPGEIQLSILPSWHAYERAVEYYGIFHGTTITYSDKRYIKQDMVKLCPHLMPCVPRIWESVYQAIQSKVSGSSERDQKMFQFFIGIGEKYVRSRRTALNLELRKRSPSIAQRAVAWIEMTMLYPIYKIGDTLIFSKLRKVTGGRMIAAVSGGGSLAPYLDDFFEAVGVPIINGYGLTETSPVLTLRPLKHNVRGTVGRAVANTEVVIRAENGDEVEQGGVGFVWARGAQIMSGYYKNPEATGKVLRDGWFDTGDLGWMTHRGDLVITGRAKDTIVLSSGENVEPEPIEDVCRKSSLVEQIMLVGQDQKSLGALVVPDFPNLAEALGLPPETEHSQIVANDKAQKAVRRSLAESMATDGRFKASESIGKVHLLMEPFSDSNGMLTHTMKIKKPVVYERYKDEITQMFG